MFFHPKNLKSENNNPWFKPWFNILLHTQSIVCATVDSQCLEYLGCITLTELCGLLHNILDWRNEWRGEKSGVPSYFLKVINLSLLYLLLTVEGQKQGETDGWGRDASHSVLWSQIDLFNPTNIPEESGV